LAIKKNQLKQYIQYTLNRIGEEYPFLDRQGSGGQQSDYNILSSDLFDDPKDEFWSNIE